MLLEGDFSAFWCGKVGVGDGGTNYEDGQSVLLEG